jgi:hypothetical protein
VKEHGVKSLAIVHGVFIDYAAARSAVSWLAPPEMLPEDGAEGIWYLIRYEIEAKDVWSVRVERSLTGIPIPSGTLVTLSAPGLAPGDQGRLLEKVPVPAPQGKLFTVRLLREDAKPGAIIEARREEIAVAEPW